MAASRRSGGGGGGSPNVVLVIFLVFFILLSMVLGVTTYFGFAQDDDKGGKLAAKTKELAQMSKDRDWYKFQAELYRTYMGHAQGVKLEDVDVRRGEFDKGTLAGPEKDDVKNLVAKLDKTFAWDAAQKRPKLTYEDLLAQERKKNEAAETASKGFQAAQAAAEKKAADLEQQVRAAQANYDMELAALKKRSNDELSRYVKQIEELNKEKDELGARTVAQLKTGEDDKRRIEKLIKDKDDQIALLRRQLKIKEDVVASLKKELGREVPVNVNLNWKIVTVGQTGDTAYINLGSADKVQPQLTFRVHGLGTDGRPMPRDKALLEVTNVLGEHLSQARVTYVTTPREKPRHDPRRDPVVPGDVLFNPTWDPNQKKHVALAGIIDLTGDGRDDTPQFIRALEKQNVVVDAYVDLQTFTVRGPGITVATDYLIVGDKPALLLGGGGREKEKEIREKLDAAMEELTKQARENGVKIRGIRQYLDEIGYRVPGDGTQQQPVLQLKPGGGVAPKEPPKNDKPAPPPANP